MGDDLPELACLGCVFEGIVNEAAPNEDMLLMLDVYHPPLLFIAHKSQNDFPLHHLMG